MKILYLWDADYHWDIRVDKICSTLYDNGYDIHIATRILKRLPAFENICGVNIHRLQTWRNDKLNYMLSFHAFFSTIWRR